MVQPSPSGGAASQAAAIGRQLRRRWWLIVLMAVVIAALFGLRDFSSTKQYQAKATLLFGTTGSNVSGLLSSLSSSSADTPDRDQATAVVLVTSSSVTSRVINALKLHEDPSSEITAAAEPDANLIDITATDPDPKRAAQLANAYANQYQAFRRATDQEGLQQGIVALEGQLAFLPHGDSTQRNELQTSITQLQQQEATTTGGVQVVDQATPPTSPSSPRTKRDLLIGLLIGAALGIAVAFALDSIDRRLRSVADFESIFGRRALAAIPQQRRALTGRRRELDEEPFRILRANLMQGPTGLSRVVLVTSAILGEGKSGTAVGLARAAAYTGRSVALVEVDLRRPTFHYRFKLNRDAGGIVDVLRGRTELTRAMEYVVDDLPSLALLPAGGTPARSAELLTGPQMQRVLSELATAFDVVVLDAPPLLPVADAQGLLDASAIDVVLVVGRVDLATRDQAVRARRIVESHGWSDFALVVNGVTGRDSDEQYGHGYGYQLTEAELARGGLGLEKPEPNGAAAPQPNGGPAAVRDTV